MNDVMGPATIKASDTTLEHLYRDRIICDGDTRIADQTRRLQSRSQASQVFRAASDRNNAEKWFQQELEDHESRRWWDNPELEAMESQLYAKKYA
jgi:hypothetical protein